MLLRAPQGALAKLELFRTFPNLKDVASIVVTVELVDKEGSGSITDDSPPKIFYDGLTEELKKFDSERAAAGNPGLLVGDAPQSYFYFEEREIFRLTCARSVTDAAVAASATS